MTFNQHQNPISSRFAKDKQMKLISIRSDLLVILAIVFSSMPASAQQDQPPAKPPCIAADEPIYKPGQDGVKPPQPNGDARSRLKIEDDFSIEFLVNAQGHVCNVRVLKAKNQSSAREAADYIEDHWTFKPATRRGKPVAVRITANFHFHR
jgi:TonB family protein